MKKILLATITLLSFTAESQLNMTLLGQLDLVSTHNSDGSDIWAYVDENNNEYAIVGLNDGTSIVDVTDPANPVEIFYEPGMNSIWRDMKTWGDYAYVTTEAANGLLIIDMTSLPNAAGITTSYYTGPAGSQWESAHNLYIDENGICYIFGANRGNGGCIMLDVATDPLNPVELGVVDTWYTHDGVAFGDTLYMGHINDGFISIHDVSDPANPVLLGTQNTPGNFAHNIWFSDDRNYVFTTDEISSGFIGAYDISDPSNISFLDAAQSNPGSGVIPHNTHTIGDWIVTSYYRDGVTVHDVSNPANLVEVGNFDTSPMSGNGFNGCWGAYPWLPSGNLILSDIESGLIILGVSYEYGCYLEGTITDNSTSNPLNGATIELVSTSVTETSGLVGDYTTGIATPGSYDIIVSRAGYYPDTAFGVGLTQGNTVIHDVALDPLPSFTLTGNVQDLSFTTPIENVIISVSNDEFDLTTTTDANGDWSISNIYEGTYDIIAGQWGYVTECTTGVVIDSSTVAINFSLFPGYYDDFSLDFGWAVSGSAPTGVWERGDPNGTTFQQNFSNPEDDINGDCGDAAYVTGNGGGNAGIDDVDDANTVLTSPSFDGTIYGGGFDITLYRWWMNAGGQGMPDDTFRISITNGSSNYVLSEYTSNDNSQQQWVYETFNVSNSDITLTTSMNLIFETADWSAGGGHLVEAGLDVLMLDYAWGISDPITLKYPPYPNPMNEYLTIDWNKNEFKSVAIEMIDISGRVVVSSRVSESNPRIDVRELSAGVYMLNVYSGESVRSYKVIK